MAQRRGFITAGTWCADYNKRIAGWPGEDTANEVLSIERQGGGSGCNMALDLRRLDPDLPVETIGVLGDDDDGRFLAAQCDAAGVGRAQLRVLSGATPSVDAFCNAASGRRTHFFHAGVAALLRPDHFDFAGSNARILHLGLPGVHKTMDGPWRDEPSGWVAALRSARAAGLETNLELMTIARRRLAALAAPCLPHLDYLIVNDFEIGAVCGAETRADGRADFAAARRATSAALERGAMRLVATHFPEGAFAATREGEVFAVGSLAIPEGETAGVNGAGDAFAAGLLYALHEGWGVERALALGHCVAAASIRAVSTTAGVTSWRECLALGERWGFRSVPR